MISEIINKTEEMIGKPVSFWGIVEEKSVKIDNSIEYRLKISIKETSEKELKSLYKLDNNEKISWFIIVKATEKYADFDKGDEVFIYGELLELLEYDNVKVPYMDAKAIKLDKDS